MKWKLFVRFSWDSLEGVIFVSASCFWIFEYKIFTKVFIVFEKWEEIIKSVLLKDEVVVAAEVAVQEDLLETTETGTTNPDSNALQMTSKIPATETITNSKLTYFTEKIGNPSLDCMNTKLELQNLYQCAQDSLESLNQGIKI